MISSPYLYARGRRRSAAVLLRSVPARLDGYVEPFLGSGSRALAVMQRHDEIPYLLNSASTELLLVWQVVRDDVDALVELVAAHAAEHSAQHFDEVRRWGSEQALPSKSPAERAARFIYLSGSATGTGLAGAADDFAGARLARDTVAFDAANLRAVSRLLASRDVRLDARPLFDLLAHVHESSFVLLAPPPSAGAERDRRASASSARDLRASASSARELRSFASSVTAKGAFLLLDGTAAVATDPGGSWEPLTPIEGLDDDAPDWANGILARALRSR